MLSIYLSMVETEEEKDLVTELYNTYKQILFNVSMSILHNTCLLYTSPSPRDA